VSLQYVNARHPSDDLPDAHQQSVNILYTNYRGETAVRRIVPIRVEFCETEWHPGKQWILVAQDLEKGAERSFACKDIRAWFIE
jgi:hypothetical protein